MMSDSSGDPATPNSSDVVPAKVELEYKTVLDLGKFMYDSYFKLAAMSFTLNGLLLASVSFLLPQVGKVPDRFIYSVGAIGVIYNMGALSTYLSLVVLTGNIAARFRALDKSLKLEVSNCRTSVSDRLGGIAIGLTVVFFLIWIGLWIIWLLYTIDINSIPYGAHPPAAAK
jgi:hypothetical protein